MVKVYLKITKKCLLAYDMETDLFVAEVTELVPVRYQDTDGFIEYNHHSPTNYKFVSYDNARVRKVVGNFFECEIKI